MHDPAVSDEPTTACDLRPELPRKRLALVIVIVLANLGTVPYLRGRAIHREHIVKIFGPTRDFRPTCARTIRSTRSTPSEAFGRARSGHSFWNSPVISCGTHTLRELAGTLCKQNSPGEGLESA